MDNTITLAGNAVADPELTFTPSGTPRALLRMAVNRRYRDRESGEMKDGEPVFVRVIAWRDLADHVAESVTKGARIIVTGELAYRTWEADNGDKKSMHEVNAADVGVSLRWATAKVAKAVRSGAVPQDEQDAPFPDEPPF